MPHPRLYKSSVVVGALVAALLILVEVPGRVVDGSHGPHPSLVFEHGWPWVYLRRETVESPLTFTTPDGISILPNVSWTDFDIPWDLPKWGIPWLSSANWQFWQATNESDAPRCDFNGLILFCDFAIALIVASVIVAAWEFRRRGLPSLFCFSLTDIFLTVASMSAVFGWLVYLEREYQREFQFINRLNVSNGHVWSDSDRVCIAPTWIRSLIGERLLPEFSWRASTATIELAREVNVNTICEQLAELKYLNKIVFLNTGERFRFSALRKFQRLETLELWDYWTLDEHDCNELAQLTQLYKIILEDKDDIPPHMLTRLESELPNCKIVDVYDDW